MRINFISSLDPVEIRSTESKSKKVEILMGDETDDIIKELFESFSEKYQEKLEEKSKDSKFVFESVELLYYSLHKTRLRRGKSYINTLEWLINKRTIINPQNKNDNNRFQYAITVALNYQKIESHPQRISNIKPFINQYNWKNIDFPSHWKDWKKFEQNNKTIALNIFYVTHNIETTSLAYKSKYKRKRKNWVVLLMITNGKKWHYLALKGVPTPNGYNRPIKRLSRLLRGTTSNHNWDF